MGLTAGLRPVTGARGAVHFFKARNPGNVWGCTSVCVDGGVKSGDRGDVVKS